jgi:predicted RNase H-like HicB family nuclease
MKQTYTAVYCQMEDRWVGWVEEVHGVRAQAKTRAAMMAALRAALEKTLSRNRRMARALAGRTAKAKRFRV